jgi:glycosyltransferase involved in cell wall biosynthesis
MSHSFCIITGGDRYDLIRTAIESIRAQNIPKYEIIVVGKHHVEPDIEYIEAEEAAAAGRLSAMRNMAVARARYENIVILDDDIILSPDWYQAFLAFGKPFDILTSQVRVPDGSRYLDHASVGGPKGLKILAEDEDDDYVYMTGGGGWVMKDYVARDVKWDEDRVVNEAEDVDFSRRCKAEGYRISHNHRMLVYHADPTYTCIGRRVARRKGGRSQAWAVNEFSHLTFWQIMLSLRMMRMQDEHAEIADFVRLGTLQGPHRWLFSLIWRRLVNKAGGELPGVRWYPTGDPDYLRTLDEYRQR